MEANFITTRITANGATMIWTGASIAIRSKNRKATTTPGAGKPTDLQHPGNGRNAARATRRTFANGATPVQNLQITRRRGVAQNTVLPHCGKAKTAGYAIRKIFAYIAIPVQSRRTIPLRGAARQTNTVSTAIFPRLRLHAQYAIRIQNTLRPQILSTKMVIIVLSVDAQHVTIKEGVRRLTITQG
ncbi:MAG: hypothetical protein HW390_3073 [Candidatus Brocadiaceae bacterium]|nr:hypothetical protein [Candidatus Brocadiaceae bacterium]